MSDLEYIIVSIIGLVIGSFLNVCIYRIPQGESIVFPPSHCSGCGNSLAVKDLLPVLSYVILRGKCRYCKEKIAVQYPLVELLTGMLFVLVYHEYGLTFEGIAAAAIVCLLVIASFIDFTHKLIPNKINLIIAAVGIVNVVFGNSITIWDSLLGLALGGGGLLLPGLLIGWMLRKEAMGGGDIKLTAACGIFLGLQRSLISLMLAFYSAAVVLVVMLLFKKLKRDKSIPFGPFLSAGTIAVILFFEPLSRILIGR